MPVVAAKKVLMVLSISLTVFSNFIAMALFHDICMQQQSAAVPVDVYSAVQVVVGFQPTGDYAFAKYNKAVEVVRYTDKEYSKYLPDPVGAIILATPL